jgi:nitrogen fixation NifU-like protein
MIRENNKMGKEFDFWQEHSMQYLEMAFRTDRRIRIPNPDGYGKHTGSCGDSVEMFLTVENDEIQFVSYDINGCMNTNACANTIAELAMGKTVAQAWEITPETVAQYLGTLPPAKIHCAEVAAGAFYLALTNYREQSAAHDPTPTAGNHQRSSERVISERNPADTL